MRDADCVRFLQWALPRLGLRWEGFRRVRRQVCKRLQQRWSALRLAGSADYRALLERRPGEWAQLDALCRISISRFYRDREVFRRLEREWLPRLRAQALARGEERLRIWSVGCASGEEPYTLALMWAFNPSWSGCRPEILATDTDPHLLARARRACYPPSSLRELPAAWRSAFAPRGAEWCLDPAYRAPVRFALHDVRAGNADAPFDLILCRNLAFTYFAPPRQVEIARRLAQALRPGGLLLLGSHETLPAGLPAFDAELPWLYVRRDSGADTPPAPAA